MANETLTTNIAGIIQAIQAETYFKFNNTIGIMDCVRVIDTVGAAGKTVDFPKYANVASSDVTQVAEGTDHSTNKQITNTSVSATVDEHVIMATVSDLSDLSTSRNLVSDISDMFTNALKAKLENDIVALFSGFNAANALAGAGVTMTADDWFNALRILKAQHVDMSKLFGVISPKQYWGPKGLRSLVTDLDIDSGGLGEDMKNKGFVSSPFGINVLVSNEINEDVASGGDAAGGIFTKNAIGLHWKGITIEAERNASLRGYELVCTGRWKEVELEDLWGCYFLSDVS